VDDIAQLLGVHHVFLADESSVKVQVWNEAKGRPESVSAMLKYLRPLLSGVACMA
jgi:hypothetical protein